MKKAFMISVLVVSAFITNAQTPEPIKKSYAEVNQYSGVYVFYMCKPVREYEYIATMKKVVVADTHQEALVKYAALAKKEYPNCEAIIMNKFENGFSKDVFDVIKFK